MKNFDIILWDVDQTLLDFDRSQTYALNKSFQKFNREITDETVKRYAAINDAWWKRHELGEVTKKELLPGRFRTLFSELGITDIPVEEFAAFYQVALGSVFFFKDNSNELCGRLRGKVRQYAVTNGVSATQRNKLRLSGLDKIMDDIFISEEMGSPKPSIQYFEECFRRIPDFQKERAVIVGDSLSSDMRGGNNAGIACCWYNPEKKANTAGLRIDYEIRNLWEIEEIL
ncbi:MAG: YjjG family noncanonical pyrimidine nucleotidase [Clostridium sp.]|nr:YjjG family noncanonical pyrimidine nucleotidase [Clostridium sp.]